MRIIAGRLGGRQFKSPPGHRSHPMSEKMRGALFNALGDIVGLSVLDAFAGSGALAYEAVSRGATATALEQSHLAIRTIKKNVSQLGIEDDLKVTRANSGTWSSNNVDLLFDIVICDPPYDKIRTELLIKLTRHVKPRGLYILSWPGNENPPAFSGFTIEQQKSYGDSQLIFYRSK